MIYGYCRISTIQQDLTLQKYSILEYSNQINKKIDSFIEDKISSQKNFKERQISKLIEQSQNGDEIIVSEASRLARDILEAMDIFKICLEKKVTLHLVKERKILSDDVSSKIYLFMFSFVAELERNFISQRTKEALQKRKQEILDKGFFISKKGNKVKKLGNPCKKRTLKLDKYQDEIIQLLDLGVKKKIIEQKYKVPNNTLNRFLKRIKYH